MKKKGRGADKGGEKGAEIGPRKEDRRNLSADRRRLFSCGRCSTPRCVKSVSAAPVQSTSALNIDGRAAKDQPARNTASKRILLTPPLTHRCVLCY